MTRTRYYRLVDGKPVPCPELDFLADWPQVTDIRALAEQVKRDQALLHEVWSEKHRRIDKTVIRGVEVSTVFLVLDHAWGDGPPVLFETMVFGGFFDELQRRYCSREAALAGHREVVEHIAQFRYVPTWLQNVMRVTDRFFRELPWRARGYKRDLQQLWQTAILYVKAYSHALRLACARLLKRIRELM